MKDEHRARLAAVMQDGQCGCGWPGPYARVYFFAGEPAMWGSACALHRTELVLAA